MNGTAYDVEQQAWPCSGQL